MKPQKILSVLRQHGSYTVIDKITVNLNIKRDYYEAEFSNLGLKNIPIDEEYPSKYDRCSAGVSGASSSWTMNIPKKIVTVRP